MDDLFTISQMSSWVKEAGEIEQMSSWSDKVVQWREKQLKES